MILFQMIFIAISAIIPQIQLPGLLITLSLHLFNLIPFLQLLIMLLSNYIEEPQPQVQLKHKINILNRTNKQFTRNSLSAKQLRSSNKAQNERSLSFLNDKNHLFLSNLLFTYRLFENKNKKVESYNEKMFESKRFIERADFQGRKINLKRQKIAKKHFKSRIFDKKDTAFSINTEIDHTENSIESIILKRNWNETAKPLFTPLEEIQDDGNSTVIKRIKTAVSSSRKIIRDLYNNHCQQQTQKKGKYKHSKIRSTTAYTNMHEKKGHQNIFLTTDSLIINPSNIPATNKQHMIKQKDDDDEYKTWQQIKEIQDRKTLIRNITNKIELDNRTKEQIVLNQFKKILYGDRKGKFIQDNAFKTRVEGEKSQGYMNVLREQDKILKNYQGSMKNRKNMIDKFSNILGSIERKKGKNK